jgi:FKBP-type peptidyl-prolyl cis-trans isomerase 2
VKNVIRFVTVTYTAKIKDTNELLEKTKEPKHFILGSHMLIKGLENALEEMNPGQEKRIVITPKNAYGERNPQLVRLVPKQIFVKHKMTPHPGMVIALEGIPARVQTVSGGRVRVDFNHMLAGRTLEYQIKIEKNITTDNEKIRVLFELVFPNIPQKDLKVEKSENSITIKLPKECLALKDLQERKDAFIENVKKFLKIENVKVIEELPLEEPKKIEDNI